MIRPLQVTFRNMQPRPELEELIESRARWLETFDPDIIGCHVVVDAPHRHRASGHHTRVRIELALPGEDVVVSHEPTLHGALKDVAGEAHHKDTDIEEVHRYAAVAVREAFDAARRRLQDAVRRRRGDVKAHLEPDHGRVVHLAADHGFIEASDGRRIYFHAASVLDDAFRTLTVGSQVTFVEEPGDRGPQASTVRALGKHHYVSP